MCLVGAWTNAAQAEQQQQAAADGGGQLHIVVVTQPGQSSPGQTPLARPVARHAAAPRHDMAFSSTHMSHSAGQHWYPLPPTP